MISGPMASGPIWSSWQIGGETMETVRDFIFMGSNITAGGDWSHEIKTLAPWKKSYDHPRQHIQKQRHCFPNKGLLKEMATYSSVLAWRIPGMVEPGGLPSMGSHRDGHDWSNLAAAAVKAMVFPVVMCGFESWTIKKAECWRIGAFELWYWRRLLRVPCTARRSKHSNLKEISPGYSLEGLMLKLKLQYFGHMMQRADSLEKTLMLGKIEGRRRRGRQRIKWLDGITTRWTLVWVNSGNWWWTGRPGMLRFMGSQRVGHDWVTELNELNWSCHCAHLTW